MTFWRSGATPVSEKSCSLKTAGGCARSISTPLNTSFCHRTSTATTLGSSIVLLCIGRVDLLAFKARLNPDQEAGAMAVKR
jgi:hypothetical protein